METEKNTKPETKFQKFKMVLAPHLKSTLPSYITKWSTLYRERARGLRSNIDDILKIDPENSDYMLVNMQKFRALEKDAEIVKGAERTVKKNLVTASLNLMGLEKVQGMNLQGIKSKSY